MKTPQLFSTSSKGLGFTFEDVPGRKIPNLAHKVLSAALPGLTSNGLYEASKRYPLARITRRGPDIVGLLFYHVFEQIGETHIYFGSAFFSDRKTLFCASLTLIEENLHGPTHLLTEAQNPEIAAYWYLMFPKKTSYPSYPDFSVPQNAQLTLKRFQDEIRHFQYVGGFKSLSSSSLFIRGRASNLTDWASDHGIDFARGENLVLLSTLSPTDTVSLFARFLLNLSFYGRRRERLLLARPQSPCFHPGYTRPG